MWFFFISARLGIELYGFFYSGPRSPASWKASCFPDEIKNAVLKAGNEATHFMETITGPNGFTWDAGIFQYCNAVRLF